MKKAYWFIVFMILVVALEVVTIWGVSLWVGKMLHVQPLPWLVCCALVFLGNVLWGYEMKKKK